MEFKEIGAVWLKKDEKGQRLTGILELDGKNEMIIIQPNTFKNEPKHPDFRISLLVKDDLENFLSSSKSDDNGSTTDIEAQPKGKKEKAVKI